MTANHSIACCIIDGSNLFETTKRLGWQIDFARFHSFLTRSMNCFHIHYYAADYSLDREDGKKHRALMDWMSYNGYMVHSKPARVASSENGETILKGNMDVEITLGILKASRWAGQLLLVSGDGDFAPVVDEIVERGTHVSILSNITKHPPSCANILRRSANYFLDLEDIKDKITYEQPTLTKGGMQ